jgi:cellobiose transport system permease protein
MAVLSLPAAGVGRRTRHRAPDAAGPPTYLILGGTTLLFLAPFYYMLVAASRPMSEMTVWPPRSASRTSAWR